MEALAEKLERLYPSTHYVNRLMTHSWGQKVVRFYDFGWKSDRGRGAGEVRVKENRNFDSAALHLSRGCRHIKKKAFSRYQINLNS